MAEAEEQSDILRSLIGVFDRALEFDLGLVTIYARSSREVIAFGRSE